MTTITWTGALSGEWGVAENWSPSSVPGASDTAVFGTANNGNTTITFSAPQRVSTVEFTANAPIYQFLFGTQPTPPPGNPYEIWLTICDSVVNHSGNSQHFTVKATGTSYKTPELAFSGTAGAGGADVYYYSGPDDTAQIGGGNITFFGTSTAQEANFTIKSGQNYNGGQVGAEVTFWEWATAGEALFTIYGGTGTAHYGFANAVFHENSNAGGATFIVKGGTLPGNDGGNAQFYGNTSAAGGCFHNHGATYVSSQEPSDANPWSNGGDTAFDGTGNGGAGQFINYAGACMGSYGGVTSFNNNPNYGDNGSGDGASAGGGLYLNYGAQVGEGGGGHVKFTSQYGNPKGGQATIVNYGSETSFSASAGYTLFYTSSTDYYPTAEQANITNNPAASKEGWGGKTAFSNYTKAEEVTENTLIPTAGNAWINNLGGNSEGMGGGYTEFGSNTTVGSATLIAACGYQGGYGGSIKFFEGAQGSTTCTITLAGNGTEQENGTLSLTSRTSPLTVGTLNINGGGTIDSAVGSEGTSEVIVTNPVTITGTLHFNFTRSGSLATGTPYAVLSTTNLTSADEDKISGYLDGYQTSFSISNGIVSVTFSNA